MRKNIDKRLWGVLGKQKTYFSPQKQIEGKKRVPLNENPFDSWDAKRSRFKRIDGYENKTHQENIHQGGVVPQDTTPAASPTPTPSFTPTGTPQPTPTPTPTPTCPVYSQFFPIAFNAGGGLLDVYLYAVIANSAYTNTCVFDLSITLLRDDGATSAMTLTFTSLTDTQQYDLSGFIDPLLYDMSGITYNSITIQQPCPCVSGVVYNYYNVYRCSDNVYTGSVLAPTGSTVRRRIANGVCSSITTQRNQLGFPNTYDWDYTSPFASCAACDSWNEANINWENETTLWNNA